VGLFAWTQGEFEQRLQGSAIRRIGHERWLRNLAVGLGNAPTTPAVLSALGARRDHPSALVREHVAWALQRHAGGGAGATPASLPGLTAVAPPPAGAAEE
jgi:epoxyqueuosine reductase